jgi:polyadenylate-binding protein
VGNVFVKNLAPTVDNKGLFDTFSVFGNILSCKVATDETGNSKGYGYVHYETAEAAQDAIQKFNGNFIDEYEVYVGPFVRRSDRSSTDTWTNLYVKHFPQSWSEEKLLELFTPMGTVASCFIQKGEDGKSKGFAFINYEEHEAAEKAVTDLHGKTVEDENPPAPEPKKEGEEGEAKDEAPVKTSYELYVQRAQKRQDRTREIKSRLDAMKEEKISKYQGMNLYVKNLDDTITDEMFRETFAKYGTITSARVMRDTPENGSASKGFGFVCYSTPEEATRAVSELNGKLLRSKPITVTLHQRKELRRAHLAATYAPRNMRFPQGQGQMPGMPYMPMYVPQGGNQQGQFPPQGRFPGQFPGQNFPGRGPPRGQPFQGRGGAPGQFFPAPPFNSPNQMGPNGQQMGFNKRVVPGGPGQQMQMGMGAQGGPGRRAGGGPGRGGAQGRGGFVGGPGMGGPMQMMQPQMMGPQGGRGGVKFNSNVRNQGGPQNMPMNGMPPQQPMPVQPLPVPGIGEPLDDQALAQADPQMQKNMIGERLYPLIFTHQPQLAGKITGMLLEMDNAELLNLIESPDALMHKIDEALIVLKNHQGTPEE